MKHDEACESLYRYMKVLARRIAFRFGQDDNHELQLDLFQAGCLAILKCPEHYVERQYKMAIRYEIMNAMTKWRWQVRYKGKHYVPRTDPLQMPEDYQDLVAVNPDYELICDLVREHRRATNKPDPLEKGDSSIARPSQIAKKKGIGPAVSRVELAVQELDSQELARDIGCGRALAGNLDGDGCGHGRGKSPIRTGLGG